MLRPAFTALVIGALAACGESGRAPDSARAAESAAAAGGAPGAPVPSPTPNTLAAAPSAGLPGQLTKPIDQYTGDEFFEFVQRLQWGGGAERQRKCKGDPACDVANPPRRTPVRVDAVNGQDSLSATSVPANGVVAVRAINRGNVDEDRYGFKANRRMEYYLIVLPGAGGNGRWRFEELDTTPGARRHASIGTGTFRPCNHPFRPGRVNRANFFSCADSHLSDSVQRSNLMMFDPSTDPVWVECTAGCCIGD